MKKQEKNIAFKPNHELARSRTEKVETVYFHFENEKEIKEIGKNKKYFVRTYGCQANLRDSETLVGILKDIGYTPAEDIADADLVVLNTCAVRENAEKKVFGEIGLLKDQFKNKPNFILGICGCMVQQESVVQKIMQKFRHVNFVIGTHNLYDLPYVIDETIKTKQQVVRVYSKVGEIIEDLPTERSSKIKAWVNITYGCDKFCTYCIVPYARGKMRSRNKEDILKEVSELKNQGYKEVTLLGQNVNSYGTDLQNNYYFADLLEDVCKLGIPRVRFVTSNPWNFDLKIIDLYKKYDNLMPYFHLPIQSGNENVLKKMNRAMKIEDYLKLIKYIKTNLKNYSISTDLIVGFPNETKEEFEDTLKLYKEVEYDNAYTFIFSKRTGTAAASFLDEISQEEKKQRLYQLNALVQEYAKKNNEKLVGRTLEVLVEGNSKTNKSVLFGYSREWKVVNFKGTAKEGDIVKVKISSASRFNLFGVQEENN